MEGINYEVFGGLAPPNFDEGENSPDIVQSQGLAREGVKPMVL